MPNGYTVTRKGYLRITSGPHRHKYLHRRMAEVLLEEAWHPFWGDKLPESIVVHHVDGRPSHNDYGNFLLLDKAIHDALVPERFRCPYTGRYLLEREYRALLGITDSAANEPPSWVTEEVA